MTQATTLTGENPKVNKKAPQELRELQVLSLPGRPVIVLEQNFKVLPKVLDDALLTAEALTPGLPGNCHVVALLPLASLEPGGRLLSLV